MDWVVPVWVELLPQAASERVIDSASSVARIFRIVMVCYLSSGEGDSGMSWMVLPSRLIFPHCSSCSTARYKEVRPMLSISESLTIESPTLLPAGLLAQIGEQRLLRAGGGEAVDFAV